MQLQSVAHDAHFNQPGSSKQPETIVQK